MKIVAAKRLAISTGLLVSCIVLQTAEAYGQGYGPGSGGNYPMSPPAMGGYSAGCSNWEGVDAMGYAGGGMCGPGGGPCGPMSGGMGGGGMGGYQDIGDTCYGAHWWDFFGEALFFNRDLSGSNDVVFSSFGIAGVSDPNVALSADDLNDDWQTGYRLAGRYQLSAVSSIEGVYMDAGRVKGTASVTSDSHDLYSMFSDFGNTPEGGFLTTDQATQHGISYESDLESIEVNCRRSWIGHRMKTSGSWLWGVRYFKLDERSRFNSIVLEHYDPINMVPDRGPGAMTYDVQTKNDLIGLQIGGEVSFSLLPGLMVVYEGKTGIYANSSEQHSRIAATTLDPTAFERAGQDDVAYAGESQLYLLYQCHPLWKLRVGYQVLWMDQVALGIDNFNAQDPFTGLRDVSVDSTSDVLYQGITAGLEFGW